MKVILSRFFDALKMNSRKVALIKSLRDLINDWIQIKIQHIQLVSYKVH